MAPALQPLSDEELARHTQAGSMAAFEELVVRYEGRIYRFIRTFCRCETDAREIVQDAFVRAYQAIAQFDTRQRFAAWLFTIARRKCVDHHRRQPPVSEPLPGETTDGDDPSAQLVRSEERRQLWDVARHHLPELQFQALWLKYVDDLDVAAIARVLDKSQTHVKVLLFRARNVLGREWAKFGEHSTIASMSPATAAPSQRTVKAPRSTLASIQPFT